MNLNFSEEEILFQNEVQAFLEKELTEDLVSAAKSTSAVFTEKDIAIEWQYKLAKKGWLVPSWPEEYGGTNWTHTQKYIFSSECAKAGAPNLIPMGLAMIGPLLLGKGTQEQKDYYIPRIISGEDYWCQGYSEPGAGSDLASLQCKAVREGDKYIINGTKIWTTHAHLANKIFCLVRTDNSGKKQEGITFLMLDMNQPGIKVEPILTMAQDHDFNQVVFTDAIADVKDRIGKENEGWSVAKYLLEFERSGGVGGSKSLSDIQFIKKLMNKQVIKIANCSGYYGDKLSAAREMVEGGPIDVLTGDYLAELTMAILYGQKLQRGDDKGYVGTFLKQIKEVAATCKEKNIKIVSNAGGLNPKSMASEIEKILHELSIDLKVAFLTFGFSQNFNAESSFS